MNLTLCFVFTVFMVGLASCYNIGVLATSGSGPQLYARSVYNATFGSSVYFDVAAGIPTLAFLSQFDALLVFPDSYYSNETTLGLVLKAYADNGGKVVTAMFEGEGTLASPGGSLIGGEFYPTYGCINYNVSLTNTMSSPSNATGIFWPLHPIVKGIPQFFDVQGKLLRASARPGFNYLPNTYTPFLWGDNSPLIVVKDNAGPMETSVVYIGFWPTPQEDSSGGYSYPWDGSSAIGNYTRDLVLNTLKYVIDDVPYLQPRRLDVCVGNTLDMAAVFASNATSYGWDSTLYSVTVQSPDALTAFQQVGEFNVTYSISAQGTPYPINGRTLVSVTDCSASSSSSIESFVMESMEWVLSTPLRCL